MYYRNLLVAVLAAQTANSQITHQIESNDYDTDLANAGLVANAMQQLSDAISVTQSVYKTAGSVLTGIEACMAQDPVFAVLGFVSSMTKLFVQHDEYRQILKQLADI